ncbi:RNA-directed DNA polymerase from mobile element jockey [Trichonephila clavipes]|nr:RNA-directed DNA polymerase from mobile element jockey [Trichonephila clavipes]
MWNCPNNSIRGCQLKTFAETLDLTIAFPDTPTRFGYRSANTLDFAIINNFHTSPTTLIRIKNPTVLEEKIEFFTAAIRSAHQFASKPIANTNHAFPPNYIRNLIRDKNRAKKQFNNTLNPAHKQNYYRLQEKLKKELKKISQQNWNNKLESLNTHDNSLWQCQKSFRKKRSNIPSLSSSSGVANSDEQKANILAINLKNNFSENKRPGDGNHPIDKDITNTLENFFDNHPSIPISPTDPDEILNYIKTLKNNKAPGSDLITNKMRGRSTGAVFLDIQKAFDRVWVSGLIYKLITNNFPPALIHLINSYLVNRSFQVRVNDTLSNSFRIKYGVPQGSLLGPLLFNIYINDMPTHPQTSTNIYADDTVTLATYKNHKTITLALNNHLNLLENFFDTWKIKINVDKTIAVLFTKRKTPTLYSTQLQ